jgi:hypothetical protein
MGTNLTWTARSLDALLWGATDGAGAKHRRERSEQSNRARAAGSKHVVVKNTSEHGGL